MMNNLSINQQYKPSFKGSDHFLLIKKIPGIVCAVCGKPTVPMDTYVKAITPLSKPLTVPIQKGLFDYLLNHYPVIFDKLITLAQKYPQNLLMKL